MGIPQSTPAVEMNPDLGFEVDFNSYGNGGSFCESYEDVYTSLLSSKLHGSPQVVARVPPHELKAFNDELLVDLVAKSDLLMVQMTGTLLIIICIVLYIVAGVIAFMVVSIIGSLVLFYVLRTSLIKKRMNSIAQTIVKHNRTVFKPRGLLVS